MHHWSKFGGLGTPEEGYYCELLCWIILIHNPHFLVWYFFSAYWCSPHARLRCIYCDLYFSTQGPNHKFKLIFLHLIYVFQLQLTKSDIVNNLYWCHQCLWKTFNDSLCWVSCFVAKKSQKYAGKQDELWIIVWCVCFLTFLPEQCESLFARKCTQMESIMLTFLILHYLFILSLLRF